MVVPTAWRQPFKRAPVPGGYQKKTEGQAPTRRFRGSWGQIHLAFPEQAPDIRVGWFPAAGLAQNPSQRIASPEQVK